MEYFTSHDAQLLYSINYHFVDDGTITNDSTVAAAAADDDVCSFVFSACVQLHDIRLRCDSLFYFVCIVYFEVVCKKIVDFRLVVHHFPVQLLIKS